MGRRLKLDKTPSNLKWKGCQLPYKAIMVIGYGVKHHPEKMFKGNSDFIVYLLRDNPIYLQWEKEYDAENPPKKVDNGTVT